MFASPFIIIYTYLLSFAILYPLPMPESRDIISICTFDRALDGCLPCLVVLLTVTNLGLCMPSHKFPRISPTLLLFVRFRIEILYQVVMTSALMKSSPPWGKSQWIMSEICAQNLFYGSWEWNPSKINWFMLQSNIVNLWKILKAKVLSLELANTISVHNEQWIRSRAEYQTMMSQHLTTHQPILEMLSAT